MRGWVCGADILKQTTCEVHKPICIQFDAYSYPRLIAHHGILNLSGFAAPHIFQSRNWNDGVVPAVLISWYHYHDCTVQIPDAGGALKRDLAAAMLQPKSSFVAIHTLNDKCTEPWMRCTAHSIQLKAESSATAFQCWQPGDNEA